jgi:hypothetical protein
MKKLGNILFYTLNTFFIGGLLAFAIIFWMMGDRFHAIIDALYLLIIVEMFYLRRKCKLLQKDNESLLEGGKVLVEQNAKLTERLNKMQDPFRYNAEIQINGQHVRMETIRSTMRRDKSFLMGFDEMERNRRLHYMETVAKQDLMESIFDTELVEIHQNFDAIHEDTVTAEIIVGVKSDKPIDEIIKS